MRRDPVRREALDFDREKFLDDAVWVRPWAFSLLTFFAVLFAACFSSIFGDDDD